MRTVRYKGRHSEVEVQVAPGRWRSVRRRSTLQVPDHIADGLLLQTENWSEVKTTEGSEGSSSSTSRPAQPPTDDDKTAGAPANDKE